MMMFICSMPYRVGLRQNTDSCLREYYSCLKVGIVKSTYKVGKLPDFFTKLPILRNIVKYLKQNFVHL